jgi:Arc/MetJ-type ribon-helix-helix transcriptional regulator
VSPGERRVAKSDVAPLGSSKITGMILGMATVKITVTIPEELAAYIKDQVTAGRFDSVSAYVTQASESLRDFDPLDLLIASMVAESGEPGDEAKAWAEEAMAKARAAKLANGPAMGDAA